MDEIIEAMARADVDYFWQDPGNRFVNFEKPIADGVRARMAVIRKALESSGYAITKKAAGTNVYEARLVEIGRITTTWAKFEHWIDQAIWSLAGVDLRAGASITSQIGSVPAKFRALQALMVEADRPAEAQKEVARLATKAMEAALIRNRFAHGPLDMGINFETREFDVYLREVSVDRKSLTFQTSPLSHDELVKAQSAINEVYLKLIQIYPTIVGKGHVDELAPPHKHA
jgi:hypothetical protein